MSLRAAEKLLVQPFESRVQLIAVHDDREIDTGSAQGHHVDLDAGERAHRLTHRRAVIADRRAHYGNDRPVTLNRYIPERRQLDDQRLEARRVVDGDGYRDL